MHLLRLASQEARPLTLREMTGRLSVSPESLGPMLRHLERAGALQAIPYGGGRDQAADPCQACPLSTRALCPAREVCALAAAPAGPALTAWIVTARGRELARHLEPAAPGGPAAAPARPASAR
ncbi:MAG: hypothetical protein IMX02_10625 [Limnochordaceae bacterium]|nr:hypothetical protein [Limnochordaceae bacterium]